MKLYDGLAMAILQTLNSTATQTGWATTDGGSIGTAGSIDFYTSTAPFINIATDTALTGLLDTSSRIRFSSTPVSTFSTGGNPAGTRATAVFSFAQATGTVATTGTAVCFAVLNVTNNIAYGSNIVFTGSVGTGTSNDINFNVVAWQPADQVSITSLTFVQPE